MKQENLFEVGESLSPRLIWLAKHGLEMECFLNGGEECPETGETIPHWVCRKIKPKGSHWRTSEIGSGDCGNDAVADYCRNSGTPHYNA